MRTKHCTGCGFNDLPIREFNRMSRTADGYDLMCRLCRHETRAKRVEQRRMERKAA